MRTKTLLLCAVSFGSLLHADNLLFNRGLPTANLNNAAGGNRSNVAWGDYTPDKGSNWAIGDTFNLGLAGSYNITDLRVWIVATDSQPPSSMWSNLTLYGGPAANVQVLSTVNTNGSDPHVQMTQVTYSNGANYQGSSGGFIDIWQVDFLLNWGIDGSSPYTFFVGGTKTALNESLYPAWSTHGPGVSPFLSASNAALSGSTQQGADNLVGEISWTGSTYTPDFFNSLGNGWDKSSDVNVQIFGTPEPTSILFLGTIVAVVGTLTRKKLQKK